MKKFIIFLAIALVASVSYGQKVVAFTTDTITNTETLVTFATGELSAGTEVTCVILATRLTGTTAGTAVFEGSIDGTIFADISAASTDTMTIVTTGTHAWNTEKLTSSGYKYYRINISSTGSHTTEITGSYMYYKD